VAWLEVTFKEVLKPGEDIPEFIEGFIDLSTIDAIRYECGREECRLVFLDGDFRERGYIYVPAGSKDAVIRDLAMLIDLSKKKGDSRIFYVDGRVLHTYGPKGEWVEVKDL